MKYPGDNATPKEVAKYFASVAKDYGLPEILPVMTSYVELTDAWTSEGDVKDVPGYLSAVDYNSVGYFQQRPGEEFGWGTYEQLIDAEYAVHRFCQEAVKFISAASYDNADELGRLCQAVQRSGHPDAYRDKGYPAAVELLKKDEEENTLWIYTDKDGWEREWYTSKYIRAKEKNTVFKTQSEGWLAVPVAEKKIEVFTWPEANVWPTVGNYLQRHPTRYFWRPDVEEWARYLVQNYSVWCNTYWEHPEGWGFNVASEDIDGTIWLVHNTSLDVWGPAGRGDWLDSDLGDYIFRLLMDYEGLPNINWIIWKRTLYNAANNWQGEPFGDGSVFMNHDDHIHVTYH